MVEYIRMYLKETVWYCGLDSSHSG